MKLGRPQGIAVLVLGILLLAGGILILVSVPSWGGWIADYPKQVAQMPLPPQVAPVAQGIAGVFGPLLQQIGGYIRTVGYFAGSLLTVISLVITAAGAMVTKGAAKQS